jgi:dCMP deaminase
MSKRVSKIDYYMNITKEVARRSTCFRATHGSIIVKDDQIISTGYNGAPRKTKDCLERGNCLRDELSIPSGQRYEMCRSVHAEQNAIINSARAGVSLLGGTIYLYSEKLGKAGSSQMIDALPCFICKKMIINSGLKDMVASRADGSYKVYQIEDWAKDWSENDLIDDKEIYSTSSCCSK